MTMNSGTDQHGKGVQVTQFSYLGLGVSDVEEWQDFAENVLGIQVNGKTAAGHTLLRMDEHHHRFVLVPDSSDDLMFQGWEVKDAAAMQAVKAQAIAFGLDVSDATAEECAERMVRGMIKFADPDGNPVEVCYGARLDHTPFVSPRGITGFVADELGFGHVVLAVNDAAHYTRYLEEVLGARLSDYIGIPIGAFTLHLTFFHVNPRHHSMAIFEKPKGPMAPARVLQHLMIEADSIDAVGLANGLFQKRGLETGTIGRHTNDHMLSFYAATPSGFHIEYGYGGSLIEDEASWTVQSYHSPSLWGHSMPKPPSKKSD